MTLNNTVNISNMSKLAFYLYYDGSSFSLNDLYLQLLSSNVPSGDLLGSSSTAGDSYALGSLGTSSLAGKAYGSVDPSGYKWVKVTLDLSKLSKGSNFNYSAVKYIRFGSDYGKNIYLRGFTFEPAAQANFEVGFVTKQYDIPDYGSATTGVLTNPQGAVYTSNKFTGAHSIDSDGIFALEDGEVVNFHDQFRRGSYIYLAEALNAKEDALYNTYWTIYENDKAVTYMADDGVVNVSSSSYDVVDVPSNSVNDGRSEVYKTGTDSDGRTLNNSGYTSTARPSAGGFVFRSYADPDSTDTTTKLKVKFTNTVNVGSLTITKEKVEGTTNLSGSFGFRVRFYNVGGIGLESEDIVLTFSLGQGESKTITGIPLNTQYSIYEIKPSESSHITLDHVTRADSTTSNPAPTIGHVDTTYTTVSGSSSYTSKAYRVDGTISASDEYNVTFYNIYKPVVSLAVTKLWKDGQNNDIANPPASITVQLQRSKNGTTWYSVTDRNIEPGYVGWKNLVYTFEDLDKYVDYPNDQTVWQYRVLEKNGVNVVAHNTSITIDGVEFVVTYSSENGAAVQDQNGNWSQTITNTQDSTISLELTKKWTYVNGQPLDPSKIPTSIMVQLQRRAKETTDQTLKSWKAVRVNGGDYVTISTNNSATWTYKFDNLEKTGSDSNGNKVDWEYRVVEWKIVDGKGIAVPNNVRVGNFKVTYHALEGDYVAPAPTVSSTDDNLVQTITNVYAPINISVTKVWPGFTPEADVSIWVTLQKKNSDGDWERVHSLELMATKAWTDTFPSQPMYDNNGNKYEYRVVEETGSGENWYPVENEDHIVRDGNLFKVTYSSATDTTTGNVSTTITNTVKYVSLNIKKQASDTKENLKDVTFKLEKVDSNYEEVVDTSFTKSDTTDANGAAGFSGLSEGYYLLTETQAASGYSLLASPIKIEITANVDGTFTIKVDNGTAQTVSADSNGTYAYGLTIYNKPKLDMPATGGVGGFEFWILGGLLIMAVPLLMYTFIWYRKGGKYLQR
jgi:hypothetical protein